MAYAARAPPTRWSRYLSAWVAGLGTFPTVRHLSIDPPGPRNAAPVSDGAVVSPIDAYALGIRRSSSSRTIPNKLLSRNGYPRLRAFDHRITWSRVPGSL